MMNSAEECRKSLAQGKRVLVVDDNIELLLAWQGLLEANDYEACLAQNGSQALKVLRNSKVDAILCDLSMPELSGDVFYWAVGCGWPQLLKCFIFVTGQAENPTYEAFLKSTKATVLFKPLAIDHLLEKLESVLGVQAQQSN